MVSFLLRTGLAVILAIGLLVLSSLDVLARGSGRGRSRHPLLGPQD